jgi:hypothetical protein
MEQNEQDEPPAHPAIERFRKRAARKVATAPQENRVDMKSLLAAFDKEQTCQRDRSAPGLLRRWLGPLFDRGPRLVWAGAAVIALTIIIGAIHFHDTTRTWTIRLMASATRGSSGGTNAEVFSEKFDVEFNPVAKTINVIDGSIICTGILREQSPPAGDIISFEFQAHGKNATGAAIIIRDGVVKLRLREGKQTLARGADVKEGRIIGEILEENRPPRRLDQPLHF